MAQDPDPGVAMAQDDVIRLYLSEHRSNGPRNRAPDLRGLPLRAAKRRVVEAGLRCDIVGSGFVTSQKPAPGGTAKNGVVRVYCDNKPRRDG